MVVYEVQLSIAAAVAEEYRRWLDDHIREMLSFDGFTHAELLLNNEQPEGAVVWIVRYHLQSQAALENYISDHASHMRAQANEKFAGKFTATRRVLAMVQAY